MIQRIVFMGTPSFAVPCLEALVKHYEIAAVVTQPDRPARRGRRIVASAVKKAAVAHELRLMQPESLRQEEAIAQIRKLQPQVIVVAAYGQILCPQVLSIAPSGVINVHPSLLPKYRGASPIAGALLAGEEETGVAIMLMDEGMDTGPILAQSRVKIGAEDTTGTLEERLAALGAELLLDTLPRWLDSTIEARAQDDSKATYTRPISSEDAVIDWELPAADIWYRIRAFNPRPGARTYWKGNLLKILRACPERNWKGGEKAGEVVELPTGVGVACGQGALALKEIQLAGKRAMGAEEFVRGQREFVGSVLGG